METKSTRINSNVHAKLKVYAAKAGVSAIDIIDTAVSIFMLDNTPIEAREGLKAKQKSKTKHQ